MKRKRVLVKAYGPWQVAPDCKVGWEDIYLILHWPKRRRLYLAPTYMTRNDLLSDIERNEEIVNDRKPRRTSAEEWAKAIVRINEHTAEMRATLKQLDANGLAIDRELDVKQLLSRVVGHTTGFALAGVYTTADGIDQKEAERMTDFYLSKLGIKNVKYVWLRTKFVVMPVSLPPKSMRENA